MASESVSQTVSQSSEQIRGDMLIGEIVARHPEVVPLFLKYGLHCVGCRVSPYETIEQGSLGHGMPNDVFSQMIAEANSRIGQWREENPSSSNAVELTASAAEQVKKIMKTEGKEGYGLRVEAVAGGCAGYSYQMDFEQAPGGQDASFETHGLTVFYAKSAEKFLAGTVIDYREALQGSGFVMRNPNAKSACGCGESFNVE
ncbi:iron-sulfur cluster assembly accessory protein [Candidatus Micrarchaeota archaeon]|nr:iron-sulfur cluster assembly accessory protein [Candidatus Micrarchaeota archaeon]